ncbi:MAG: selenide, water dikinase SelD [Planctomycetota bacterium]
MKSATLGKHQVVLLGVGHTNAHVARMWKMKRPPDAELVCVSDRSVATYSGMLPATLAGQIPQSQMEIDLVRFCSSVGARLIVGRVKGIDHARSELLFDERPRLRFDVLSIGIGSVPTVQSLQQTDNSSSSKSEDWILKIKPMQTFLQRLKQRLENWKDRQSSNSSRRSMQISVVGSGIAGVEILFCLPPYLKQNGISEFELSLVTRSSAAFQEGQANTRRRIGSELAKRGHALLCNRQVVNVSEDKIHFEDGTNSPADLVIWATGASAPHSLQQLGLVTDERGFLKTDATLRAARSDASQSSNTNPSTIFAVGDTGTIAGSTSPKAGVYAVRQGPILWQNIQRVLAKQPLLEFKPQSSFLSLINLGDGRAIGQWKGLSFSGEWVYRLKHGIDSKFMEKFEPIPMEPDDPNEVMQCHGCGCKFASTYLDSVLETVGQSNAIVPDDAARIGGDKGSDLYASTDFFTDPVNDPYLFGRLAALHSASDLIATGVGPSEALANVALPEGHPRAQESVLTEFMEGAAKEFSAIGAKVVGGHTIVGPRMEAGFTVVGAAWGQTVLQKSGLAPGDGLYLTKPLGIGVILAAHMRSLCAAPDFEELLDWMLKPQHMYAKLAVELGVTAATDVTGFGLAGHLLEMLRTSGCSAELQLDQVPILASALRHSEEGIASSLLPNNMALSAQVEASDQVKSDPRYPLLFDPQTCGGLLFSVPANLEPQFLSALEKNSLPPPKRIGHVLSSSQATPLKLNP